MPRNTQKGAKNPSKGEKEEEVLIQAEFDLGLIGHVDHGKSTLVKALSGKFPDTHSEELRRGISIRLGYAIADFRKCPDCEPPQCYTTSKTCPNCGSESEFLRRISFVDCPGHEILMATMLSGATIMDGAILVIATNEDCPQPQTKEHLAATEVVKVDRIVIAQNKIELVSEEEDLKNYENIKSFVKGSSAEDAPIIPISAMHKANLDVLIQAIEEKMPTPKRDSSLPARMYVARSFEVNKPGTRPKDLMGGVLGGSIVQGELHVGEEIEIKPGVRKEIKSGKFEYVPLITEITSLSAGPKIPLEIAKPGGLIGVGTKLDPFLTKSDSMVGSVVGKPDTLPPTVDELNLEVTLMERAVGTAEEIEVKKIKIGEKLMLNVGTAATVGTITGIRDGEAQIKLSRSIVGEKGMKAAISRLLKRRWRLVGYGNIL